MRKITRYAEDKEVEPPIVEAPQPQEKLLPKKEAPKEILKEDLQDEPKQEDSQEPANKDKKLHQHLKSKESEIKKFIDETSPSMMESFFIDSKQVNALEELPRSKKDKGQAKAASDKFFKSKDAEELVKQLLEKFVPEELRQQEKTAAIKKEALGVLGIMGLFGLVKGIMSFIWGLLTNVFTLGLLAWGAKTVYDMMGGQFDPMKVVNKGMAFLSDMYDKFTKGEYGSLLDWGSDDKEEKTTPKAKSSDDVEKERQKEKAQSGGLVFKAASKTITAQQQDLFTGVVDWFKTNALAVGIDQLTVNRISSAKNPREFKNAIKSAMESEEKRGKVDFDEVDFKKGFSAIPTLPPPATLQKKGEVKRLLRKVGKND